MKSTFVLYMNTCYRMSSKDKKEEPLSRFITLTWLFAVPSVSTIETKAAMATPDFPALELMPDHLLKFRINPAY